jgi:integrase
MSRLFQALIELLHLDVNPARQVKNLSEKSGQRQVYIGLQDFTNLLEHNPAWFRPIVQAAYFTGMRRGEIQKLKRHQVRLGQRMILIGPGDTKEGSWKRVPIHSQLGLILEDANRLKYELLSNIVGVPKGI